MQGKKVAGKIVMIVAIVLAAMSVGIAILFLKGRAGIEQNLEGQDAEVDYKILEHNGKKYTYRDEFINILCMGIDKDVKMSERNDYDNSMGQADSIFLASIDKESKELRIIAVPRDVMVVAEKYDTRGYYLGTETMQLYLQYAWGDGQEDSASMVAKHVSEIFNGIPINGYAAINFTTIMAINDAIGGVEVTMDEDYTDINESYTKGATIRLYGEQALRFIRSRDTSQYGTAYSRMLRQRQYVTALFEQTKIALKENTTLPVSLMSEFSEHICTNLTVDEVMYLATEVLDCSFSMDNLYVLKGETVRGEKWEEFILDEEGVTEQIIELFYE